MKPLGTFSAGSQVSTGNADICGEPAMWRPSIVTPCAFVPWMLKLTPFASCRGAPLT